MTALALLVAGCSGDGPSTGTPGDGVLTPSTATAGVSPTTSTGSGPTGGATGPTADPNAAYGLPLPAGVRLTALGTTLTVGQPATVAWRPTPQTVGVLQIRVTALRQGLLADFGGFVLGPVTRRATPYYVDATVTNVGRGDLGGAAVPLVMVDRRGTLVEASRFQSTFTPCSATPLPSPFKHGATAPVCLVFLAADHGSLDSVAFRPRRSYAAIRWIGTILAPALP